jgi:anaerobic selenocysteine-containing dehydrogenase
MGSESPVDVGRARLSRRDFVRVMGATAVAASVAGCAPEGLSQEQGRPTGPEPAPLAPDEWAATVCRICPAGCGVLARAVDGRVVKLEGNPAHPLNQGKPCPRAQAAQQVLYDPDRLQGPLRRAGERGEGRWEPVSWEVALGEIANRLREMRERDKAHNLMFLHNAPPGHMRELITRFCHAYGTPNVVAGDDGDAERLAHQLTQGWLDLAAYDWEDAAYVLFFGGSFLEDWQPQVHMLRAFSYMRRGRPDRRARLVQIGPRFSVSAAKADEWVPILPGRQGALALGMAHVIIGERLYDYDFVENHTEGFDELVALVMEAYAPTRVAGLTGVPAETITRLAREFAGQRPAVAAAGRGLSEGTNELFTQVAIQFLNALVGSIDVPGGVLRPRQPPFAPWGTVPEVPDSPRVDGAGGPDYPLAAGAFHGIPGRILAGPRIPEVLLLYEVNPLHEGAGGALQWEYALRYIPLVVSFSSFMDESTLHADLVLPNHTFLERWVDGTPPGGLGIASVGIGRPAVRPLYDTRHTGDVLLDLAQAVGGPLADHLPWSDFSEVLRFRAEGLFEAGGSIEAESFDDFWDQLLERGVWFGAPYVFGQWEEVLATPSGRYQFRLEGLEPVEGESLGLGAGDEAIALPHYEPPNYAGDEKEFPLHLVPFRVVADAGGRAPNAPLLWELYGLHLKESWHSWVEINPETAHHLGLQDGDQVWVESPQRRVRLKARLYEGAMPDVVSIPMGGGHTAGGRWAAQVGGGNVCELVVPQMDRLAGTAAWCGTRVRVYKSEERM